MIKKWKLSTNILMVIVIAIALFTVIFHSNSRSVFHTNEQGSDESNNGTVEPSANKDTPITSVPEKETPKEVPREKTKLEITSPEYNAAIKGSKATIKGTISNNAKLFINDVELPIDTSKGSFSFEVELSDIGSNLFHVRADIEGKESMTRDLNIYRTRTAAELAEEERIAAQIAREQEQEARRQAQEEQRRQAEERQRAIQADNDYKNSCKSISYNKLVKNPDSYSDQRVKFRGEIFQAGNDYGKDWFIISVTNNGYGFWSDNIWVTYNGSTDLAKDDIVQLWGEVVGGYTYTSTAGYIITIPEIKAVFIQ